MTEIIDTADPARSGPADVVPTTPTTPTHSTTSTTSTSAAAPARTRSRARGDELPGIAPVKTGGRMTARSRLVLFVLCAANFMVAIDFSILNIALPSIGTNLHFSEANLQWIATAFSLPSGGFLLLFGRFGDLAGRRRVFVTGLAVFTLSSLLAAFAWDPAALLAARALQGLGAAAIVPTGMALLTTSFAEGPERDRALGIAGSLMAFGFTVGVVLGGVLTQALGWRSTMALSVIMGAAVSIAAPLLVGESRNPHHSRLDIPGAVTVTGGLLAAIYALTTAAQSGWGRPGVIAALTGGVALLVAFLVIESRVDEPLVSLKVLRRRTVALGNLGGLTAFAMASSVVFLGTLFLQQIHGMSPTGSGLVFGVMGVAAAIGGAVAPRVVGRFGSPRTLVVSLFAQGVTTAVIALIGRGDGVAILLIAGVPWAFVQIFAIVAYGVTATSGLANHEQGMATGLVTTAQQVGLTVGIPLLSAIAASRSNALQRAGRSASDGLLSGIHVSIGVDAAILVAVSAVLAVGLRGLGKRG